MAQVKRNELDVWAGLCGFTSRKIRSANKAVRVAVSMKEGPDSRSLTSSVNIINLSLKMA